MGANTRRRRHGFGGIAILGAALSLAGVTVGLTGQPVEVRAASCGCPVGPYTVPAVNDVAIKPDGTSPNGIYQVTVTGGSGSLDVTVTTKVGGSPVLDLNEPAATAMSWGFSPNDNAFVLHYLTVGSVDNVFLYNLKAASPKLVWQSASTVATSRIAFSPNGVYLLYATTDGAFTTTLSIVNTTATTMKPFTTTFTFQSPPGGAGDQFGVAGWGFSTDPKNSAFIYSYVTGQTSFDWNLVNPATGATVDSESIDATGFWEFSPCGDVAALVTQSNPSFADVRLIKVSNGSAVGSTTVASNAAISFHSSLASPTSVDHFITVNGTDQRLATLAVPAADVCVPPAALSGLSVKPAKVIGPGESVGTVVLSGAAPTGGFAVTLATGSKPAVVTVPGSVTVPAGKTTTTFTISVGAVTAATSVTISASAKGITRQAILVVIPPPPNALMLFPSSVTGGQRVTGQVTLGTPAPAGGLIVPLTSSDTTVATVPKTVAIPAKSSSVVFPIATNPVAARTTLTITASPPGSGSVHATLTIRTAVPVAVTVCPSTFVGAGTAVATVTLNAPAAATGPSIALASSSPLVTVPTTMLVPAASTKGTFRLQTSAVTSPLTVTISAAAGGVTVTGDISLRPVVASDQPLIDECSLPTPFDEPTSIATGPDGALWFAENGASPSAIARITTDFASISEFALADRLSLSQTTQGITAGPDGAEWFTQDANQIGRIDTNGDVSVFSTLPVTRPTAIVTGPDGNLWFTADNAIGRMTPKGVVSSFPVAGSLTNIPMTGMTVGKDGAIWFTESQGIGRIDRHGNVSNYKGFLDGSGASAITAGPDGNMWFVGNGRIGKIGPSGETNLFCGGLHATDLSDIAAGPDGNLWFTEYLGGVGRITPNGAITEFATPSAAATPMGITRGSDGNLWITYNDPDNGNPQIARLTPPQSPVYLTPDRASTIALGLTPARIPADGRTSSLATATLTNAGGSLVTGECVVFTSNGKQAIGSVTRNADGTDSARISSTTTPGTALISVTDVSVTPHISASAMLTQVGPASALRLTLTPPVLVADGKAAGTVTATVNDINGNGVSGEHVSFTSDGGQPIGSVADHGDGTYTATVTATTRAGTSTMTATDSTGTSLTATAALRQIAGPASALSLTLQPAALIADGVSTSVLVATIHDTNGNAVPGDRVKFSSDGGQHIGPVTDNQDGTYSTTLTATARAGISTITATDGAVTPSLTGTAVLRQTAAPAAVLSVTVQPTSIVADGKATSVATAAIQDANGNSVAGETVTFRSDGGQHVGPVTDNHDGTYSAVVTATTTAGSASIVATDTATMPNLVGAATLRQVAGPPSVLVLTLQPASIVADGNATSVATATIRDPNGNGIAGQTIQITSDGGQRIGRVTDNGDGTYRATISATTMAGSSSITATDTTPSPSLTGSVTLVQTAEPATLVIITVTPTTPTVGLGSTVQFTASATYSHGPVKDVTGSARWTSSDPGVASVSAGGKASALAVGHTTITATFASVSGAATLQVVNTPAGTGVVVSPVDAATGLHPVTLTFASVAAPGTTSLTISNAGAAPPQGFALGNPATYLDLHTTATFSGAVSICVDYGDSTTFGTKDPKLFHMVGGSWHDITTSLDLSHHVVCGSTTSLSPFAAFAPSAPENSSGSGQPIVLAPTGGPPVNLFLGLLSVLTGCAVMLGRRRSSVKGP